MLDADKIARKLLAGEVATTDTFSPESGEVADYWRLLVETILDAHPAASETVITYLVGEE